MSWVSIEVPFLLKDMIFDVIFKCFLYFFSFLDESEEDDIVIPKSSRDQQQQQQQPQQSGSQLSVADSTATDDDIVVTTSRPRSVQGKNTFLSVSDVIQKWILKGSKICNRRAF